MNGPQRYARDARSILIAMQIELRSWHSYSLRRGPAVMSDKISKAIDALAIADISLKDVYEWTQLTTDKSSPTL